VSLDFIYTLQAVVEKTVTSELHNVVNPVYGLVACPAHPIGFRTDTISAVKHRGRAGAKGHHYPVWAGW
jgi:hypothetical protein